MRRAESLRQNCLPLPEQSITAGQRRSRGTPAKIDFSRRTETMESREDLGSRSSTSLCHRGSYRDIDRQTAASTPRALAQDLSSRAFSPMTNATLRRLPSRPSSPLGRQVSIFSATEPRRSPDKTELLSRSIERMLYSNMNLKEKIELLEAARTDLELKNSRAAADRAFLEALPSALPSLRVRQRLARDEVDSLQRRIAVLRAQVATFEAKNAANAAKVRALRTKQALVSAMRKEVEQFRPECQALRSHCQDLERRLSAITFAMSQKYEERGRSRAESGFVRLLTSLQSKNPEVQQLVRKLGAQVSSPSIN